MNSLRNLATITAVASGLTLAAALCNSPGHADQESFPTHDGVSAWWQSAGTACASRFERIALEGANCVADQFAGLFVHEVARLGHEQGRALLGDGFGVVHRLSWSPFGEGIAGNLDVVIPLASSGRAASLTGGQIESADANALFFQHGVTRWTDSSGLRRNDLRHGTVYRSALVESGTFIGLSAFFQENIERGHQRLVTGIDYGGTRGSAWLQHFVPITGWLPGRPGYEEGALGGTELGLSMDVSTTIALSATLGRWEVGHLGHNATVEGRIGIDWRPHPWLNLNAGWNFNSAKGEQRDPRGAANALLRFTMPLGGVRRTPSWEGLGLADESRTPADIWQPIENVGRIRIVERTIILTNSATQVDDVSVRFLQNSAVSGSEVRVEVTLPSPAPEDTLVRIHLAPGSGARPAMAGVDYVDEPIDIVVLRGNSTARTSIRLLANKDLTTSRTLTVSAALER